MSSPPRRSQRNIAPTSVSASTASVRSTSRKTPGSAPKIAPRKKKVPVESVSDSSDSESEKDDDPEWSSSAPSKEDACSEISRQPPPSFREASETKKDNSTGTYPEANQVEPTSHYAIGHLVRGVSNLLYYSFPPLTPQGDGKPCSQGLVQSFTAEQNVS